MIYVVRHGQTDWNLSGRYGGQIDVELNETGIEQAKYLKEKLKDIHFDKVYSSPLKRALHTAKIIYDGDIIIDHRIMERSNGLLEGKLKSEIKDTIDFNDPNETKYNIESIVDFRNRINSFLDEVRKNDTDKNVLIVTHAGVGIYIRAYFEGEPIDNNYYQYKLGNGEVVKYKCKKK